MYTHYWEGIVTEKTMQKAVKEIKFIYENRPKVSRNAGYYYKNNRIALENDEYCWIDDIPINLKRSKKYKPIFSDTLIRFNGLSRLGLDHETFMIKIGDNWEFCKTNRKPYDFMVCICLIALANNSNDNGKFEFTFSSDGNYDDWKHSIKTYEKYYTINFPIKEWLK